MPHEAQALALGGPEDDAVTLTTGEAAAVLGAHTSTVKRWFADAAGRGQVSTTAGGHRRIRLDAVLGVARSRGRRLHLHDFGDEAGRAWAAEEAAATGDADPALDALERWLCARRPELIGRFLKRIGARGGAPEPSLLDSVYGGFMRRVGAAWGCGELRIGDERTASREAAAAVAELLSDAAPQPGEARKVAVVATLEGEAHTLGSQLVRLVLVHRGWRVEHLGTGLPIGEMVAMQRALGALLLCVSLTPPRGPADARRLVEGTARLADPGRPFSLVLGGSALAGAELAGPQLAPPGSTAAFARFAVLPSLAAFDEWLDDWPDANVRDV